MDILEKTFGPAIRVGLAMPEGTNLSSLEKLADEAVEHAVEYMRLVDHRSVGPEKVSNVFGALGAAADGITLHLVMGRRLGLSPDSDRDEVSQVSDRIRMALYRDYDSRFAQWISAQFMKVGPSP